MVAHSYLEKHNLLSCIFKNIQDGFDSADDMILDLFPKLVFILSKSLYFFSLDTLGIQAFDHSVASINECKKFILQSQIISQNFSLFDPTMKQILVSWLDIFFI